MRNFVFALILAMVYTFSFVNVAEANPNTPVKVGKKLYYMEKMVSQFATVFNPNSKARTSNIIIARKKLNALVIMPNEVVSFNDRVGPRVKEAGFVEAASYSNGKVTTSVGGGVCQLASTLSGAVINLKLKVVERYRHSLPVSYVSPEREATVAYGFKDFKFQNTTKDVLFVKSFIIKNKLYVEFWRCNPKPNKI